MWSARHVASAGPERTDLRPTAGRDCFDPVVACQSMPARRRQRSVPTAAGALISAMLSLRRLPGILISLSKRRLNGVVTFEHIRTPVIDTAPPCQ
jgi:hypothetical protein